MSNTLPLRELGGSGRRVSCIGLGCMGLAGTWDPSEVGPEHIRRAVAAFTTAVECGITLFDHADIYGSTACESIFRHCLASAPGIRREIFIATKVGIRRGFYEHDEGYIRSSIRGSLDRLGIEHADLYQLHRPDPFTHPAEAARAMDALVDEGLVDLIGISNYYPEQTRALQKYLKRPIVSNQIEISLLRLAPIYEGAAGGGGDGVLDQCMGERITPLAYSPVGRGWLTGRRDVPTDHHQAERIKAVLATAAELSPKYGGATPVQLSVAWLLAHPAGIIPLVGSNNPDHIREAAEGALLEMTREDWYRLWVAARGNAVP
ncbi:MAG: aldo/keto reductase [Armatimonadetes bacterium]|nr:aldo/keto reductase [Armatimonadota bacterium]MDE2206716.1 aldo/keto reductase [Armatimonadota bacterium]